jgi:hypothetical protein
MDKAIRMTPILDNRTAECSFAYQHLRGRTADPSPGRPPQIHPKPTYIYFTARVKTAKKFALQSLQYWLALLDVHLT